jgi:hypothetical protein
VATGASSVQRNFLDLIRKIACMIACRLELARRAESGRA